MTEIISCTAMIATTLQNLPVIEQPISPILPTQAYLEANILAKNFVFDDEEENFNNLWDFFLETNDTSVLLVCVKYLLKSNCCTADQVFAKVALLFSKVFLTTECNVKLQISTMIAVAQSLNNLCYNRDAAILLSIFASKLIRSFSKTTDVSIQFHKMLAVGGYLAEQANCTDMAVGFYTMAWKMVLAAKEDYLQGNVFAAELMKTHTMAAYLIIIQCKTISASDYVMLCPLETLLFMFRIDEFRLNELILAMDVCVRRRLVNPEPYSTLFEIPWNERVAEARENIAKTNRDNAPQPCNICLVCKMWATHVSHSMFFCDIHVADRERRRFD